MYCWIRGNSVAASLCSTSTRKHSPVTLSIPPNTQCPSTIRPRLYFLLPNLLSSISTSAPGPPITAGWSIKYCAHTSLIKLYQSTAVWSDTLRDLKGINIVHACRPQMYLYFSHGFFHWCFGGPEMDNPQDN